jgi:hypothetical protein
MNLPELIEKHNLKEGDKVNSISKSVDLYSKGIKTLIKVDGTLGFYEGGSFWKGAYGEFELLEPVNKFVRSQCKNTAENQLALFALGYKWVIDGQKVQYLISPLIATSEDGFLYVLGVLEQVPELYEFTTIATLKPENQLDRIEAELKALTEQLNKLKESK